MSQPHKTEERLKEGDENIVEIGMFSLSKNEAHALQMGMVGFLAGVAYSTGFQEEAVTVTTLLILTSMGARRLPQPGHGKRIGILTTGHEPWYFIISYILSGALGVFAAGGI